MELRNLVAAATVAVGALMSAPLSGAAEPAVKVLTVPADPAAGAVLVGRVASGTLVFQLEIEGAEDMWMLMDPMMGMGTP